MCFQRTVHYHPVMHFMHVIVVGSVWFLCECSPRLLPSHSDYVIHSACSQVTVIMLFTALAPKSQLLCCSPRLLPSHSDYVVHRACSQVTVIMLFTAVAPKSQWLCCSQRLLPSHSDYVVHRACSQVTVIMFSVACAERGWVVIIDARHCHYRHVKHAASTVKAALGNIRLLLVVRPDGFWEKQRVDCRKTEVDNQVRTKFIK